jgi:hypothetical protein
MKIQATLVLAAALLIPAMAAGPAWGAEDPYQQCKDSGFANYIDPATGKAFTNQGQCMTAANDGPLVELAKITTAVTDVRSYRQEATDPLEVHFTVTYSGLTPGATFSIIAADGLVGDQFVAAEDGTFSTGFSVLCSMDESHFIYAQDDTTGEVSRKIYPTTFSVC